MLYLPKQIKPVPTQLRLKCGKVLSVTEVVISDTEYDLCQKHSYNMWCSKKSGVYGKGILNSANDPCKVERLGLLGEMAMCKCVNKPINLGYIEHGDTGFDFKVGNYTFDIKTASYNYEMVCIQVINEYGTPVQKFPDGYIAAFQKSESLYNKTSTIVLVGYQTSEFVNSLPTVPARRGKHFNKELMFKDLENFFK